MFPRLFFSFFHWNDKNTHWNYHSFQTCWQSLFLFRFVKRSALCFHSSKETTRDGKTRCDTTFPLTTALWRYVAANVNDGRPFWLALLIWAFYLSQVLKDPGKPQGKGNFWAVDLSRVPLELLKRQNTAVSRQDETIFAQDLAPYILQGYKPDSQLPPAPTAPIPPVNSRSPSTPQEDLFQPKLDSSFAIDSLLHSLRPPSTSEDLDGSNRGCWGRVERARASPPPRPRYASSARSASASSASPASTSSSSDEEWKGAPLSRKRVPLNGEDGSDDYEDYRPPAHKSARREPVAPPWELPTSYAKYAPPNAVAPPSMRFNGGPLMPLHGGLPLYGYGSSPVAPGHFLSHAYWPILPNGRVSVQAPPLIMDLDNMLQSVPPNKSVFDVLVPNSQNSHAHHQAPGQYALQNGHPLNRYPQYWPSLRQETPALQDGNPFQLLVPLNTASISSGRTVEGGTCCLIQVLQGANLRFMCFTQKKTKTKTQYIQMLLPCFLGMWGVNT